MYFFLMQVRVFLYHKSTGTPHTSVLQKYSADDIKKCSSPKNQNHMVDLPDQTVIETVLGCLGLSGELFIILCACI